MRRIGQFITLKMDNKDPHGTYISFPHYIMFNKFTQLIAESISSLPSTFPMGLPSLENACLIDKPSNTTQVLLIQMKRLNIRTLRGGGC